MYQPDQNEPVTWAELPEVADHLHVSIRTARRFVREQRLPAHKIGTRYLFNLREVDRWIESRCTTTGPAQTARRRQAAS